MLHFFILLVFGVTPLTHPTLAIISIAPHRANPLSQKQRPQLAVRSRRSATDASHYLGHGRSPKFSVRFDQQELLSESFAKRRLEALKDLVSLQFRPELHEPHERQGKPRRVLRRKKPAAVQVNNEEQSDQDSIYGAYDKQFVQRHGKLSAVKSLPNGDSSDDAIQDADDDAETEQETKPKEYISEELLRIFQNLANAISSTREPRTDHHPMKSRKQKPNEAGPFIPTDLNHHVGKYLGRMNKKEQAAQYDEFIPPRRKVQTQLPTTSPQENLPDEVTLSESSPSKNQTEGQSPTPTQQVLSTSRVDYSDELDPSIDYELFRVLGSMLVFNDSSTRRHQMSGRYLLQSRTMDVVAVKDKAGELIWMAIQVAGEGSSKGQLPQIRHSAIAFDKKVLLPIIIAMIPIALFWTGHYIDTKGWWTD